MKDIDTSPSLHPSMNAEAKPMFFMSSDSLAGPQPARSPFPAIRLGLGVRNLAKKPTRFKIGIVTVTEGKTPKKGESFWELRYVDPDSGKEVKRRVAGLSREEITAMADHLTRMAYQGKGYLAGLQKASTLEDGILQAVKLSTARPHIKIDMIQRAKKFQVFMAENFPAARTWGDLKPGMVKTYIRQCETAGLAFDSIRLRLVPVKLAWRRMHQDWPDLVKAVPSLRLTTPPRREIDCLNPAELAAVLDWLRIHARDLWPMACLQGLAGLRTLEAAALRFQDVDLEAGTVTILDTGRHQPKTRDSWRTIPVCKEVVDALRQTMIEQRVRPTTGELFTNADGNPWKQTSLTRHWRRMLDHMAATPAVIQRRNGRPMTVHKHGLGMVRLNDLPARKLRAAFATMVSHLGAPDRLLKAYLGHSAGDMLGGHYRQISLKELRSVSDLMNGWRQHLEEEESWKDSGNTSDVATASF